MFVVAGLSLISPTLAIERMNVGEIVRERAVQPTRAGLPVAQHSLSLLLGRSAPDAEALPGLEGMVEAFVANGADGADSQRRTFRIAVRREKDVSLGITAGGKNRPGPFLHDGCSQHPQVNSFVVHWSPFQDSLISDAATG